jgi:hypothetical protein
MRVQANTPIRTVRFCPARKGVPGSVHRPTLLASAGLCLTPSLCLCVYVCVDRGLLVNAKERLRVYRVDAGALPVLAHEFKDEVNRCTWRQACFSSDSELVAGGTGQAARHPCIYRLSLLDGLTRGGDVRISLSVCVCARVCLCLCVRTGRFWRPAKAQHLPLGPARDQPGQDS